MADASKTVREQTLFVVISPARPPPPARGGGFGVPPRPPPRAPPAVTDNEIPARGQPREEAPADREGQPGFPLGVPVRAAEPIGTDFAPRVIQERGGLSARVVQLVNA